MEDSEQDSKEHEILRWETIYEDRLCPECGAKDSMSITARGGLGLNIQCGECQQKFWITPMKGFGAQKL